jgi:hypothetical protein
MTKSVTAKHPFQYHVALSASSSRHGPLKLVHSPITGPSSHALYSKLGHPNYQNLTHTLVAEHGSRSTQTRQPPDAAGTGHSQYLTTPGSHLSDAAVTGHIRTLMQLQNITRYKIIRRETYF